ncbi:MAG: CARDB domain-containing protein [Acidobacteriota bacterium]
MRWQTVVRGWIVIAVLWGARDAVAQHWARTYGGGGDEAEYGGSIRTTQDGGYIFVSSTTSFGRGSEDVWVVKLNGSGDVAWQKVFGGDQLDRGIDIQEVNGGYLVAAQTYSFGQGSADVWILKLDANGAVLWQRVYGGASSDVVRSIEPASDGGCYLAGLTESFGAVASDAWIVRLTSAGAISSEKRRHINGSEGAVSVIPNGLGYVMLGYGPGNNGSRDFWFSTSTPFSSPTGHLIGAAQSEFPNALSSISGGGWYVAGQCVPVGLDFDALLMKLSSGGSPSWQKRLGTGSSEWFNGGTATADGGYAAIGSYGGVARDIWIVRFSSDGAVSWQRTYGGTANDEGHSIRELADGSFIVLGGTKSYGASGYDVMILRLSAAGEIDPSCAAFTGDSIAQASDWAVQDDTQRDSTRFDTAAAAVIPAYTTANTVAAESTVCVPAAGSADLSGSWNSVRKSGRRVTGTFVCSNTGSQASGGFTVRVYLSRNSGAGRRATLVTNQGVAALAAGATFDIPVSENAGRRDRYLVAVVDRDNTVPESNEGNNSVSVRIR